MCRIVRHMVQAFCFAEGSDAVNTPLRMCKAPGCMRLTSTGWCQEHQPKYERGSSSAWHHLYTNPRYGWRHRRAAQLTLEPFCRECAKHGRRVKATEADHVTPHRGNVELFCKGELQSLCHRCHSRKTVQENKTIFAANSPQNK